MDRVIEGFSKYKINEFGVIHNRTTGYVVSRRTNKGGYLTANLINDDGAVEWVYIHRLVAQAFIPNPQGLHYINHIDEDKVNCHVSNLEWTTMALNDNHASRNKRIGEAHRKMCKVDGVVCKSYIAAAQICGVHQTSISNAFKRGQTKVNGHRIEMVV